MSMARKCDRCGKFYEVGDYGATKSGSFVTGVAFKRQANDAYCDYRDLCRDCIDGLKLFLDGAELCVDKE